MRRNGALCVQLVAWLMIWSNILPVHAEEVPPVSRETSDWHYGGFVDLAYMLDFNFPENHLWRGRTTTPRVNELDLNWAGIYVRKDAAERSRWGVELLGQAGEGTKKFGFATNSPKVGSSDQLRHFGRANVSYLAPIGNGLTIQGGLFNTFLGYDSLYAQDNVHYTRAWGGDYTPYMMFGANASYPFTDQLTGAVFVINEYSHLAHANDLPSYGGQLAYKATPALMVKETLYYGPDQAATALKFWRCSLIPSSSGKRVRTSSRLNTRSEPKTLQSKAVPERSGPMRCCPRGGMSADPGA